MSKPSKPEAKPTLSVDEANNIKKDLLTGEEVLSDTEIVITDEDIKRISGDINDIKSMTSKMVKEVEGAPEELLRAKEDLIKSLADKTELSDLQINTLYNKLEEVKASIDRYTNSVELGIADIEVDKNAKFIDKIRSNNTNTLYFNI